MEIRVNQIGSRFGRLAGFSCSVLQTALAAFKASLVLSIGETIFFFFKGKIIPPFSG